jgi:hypothetical protein
MPSPEDWAVERDGEAEHSVHTRRCRNWESYALERETVAYSDANRTPIRFDIGHRPDSKRTAVRFDVGQSSGLISDSFPVGSDWCPIWSGLVSESGR